MQTLEQLITALRDTSSAVITTHISPDPDAIGSSAALLLALQELNVSVNFYHSEAVPEILERLASGIRVVNRLPDAPFDSLIVLDTASAKRIGGPTSELCDLAEQVINIDHHSSNPGWGDVNYIRSDAASTASIVFEIIAGLQVDITADMANLLLAGLMDDTGCFRFSNADAESFEIAAHLVRLGASPAQVANELYFSIPERVLTLRARALSSLQLYANGRIAVVSVSSALLKECAASAEDTEGLVDYARSLKGTRVAVFLREMEDGWKVSLRAKDELLDVNAIASAFGGGGHRAAAGCKVLGTLDEARTKIVFAVEQLL